MNNYGIACRSASSRRVGDRNFNLGYGVDKKTCLVENDLVLSCWYMVFRD